MNLGTSEQILCLMGATASGKTDLALRLSDQLGAEIISVDSALIYRDMNIGTAKPSRDVLVRHPHHLIDILDPKDSYSAAQFCSDALRLIAEIRARGRRPLLVGGTMLYFKALQQGLSSLPPANLAVRQQLDEEAAQLGWPVMHQRLMAIDPLTAQRLSPHDSQRIQRALEVYQQAGKPMSVLLQAPKLMSSLSFVNMAIDVERAVLHRRIAQRFDLMLAQGLIEEVKSLRDRGDLSLDLPSMRCVGYRQVWQFLDGQLDYDTMREQGIAATRQLAKRQLTWLRSWPDVQWISLESDLTIGE